GQTLEYRRRDLPATRGLGRRIDGGPARHRCWWWETYVLDRRALRVRQPQCEPSRRRLTGVESRSHHSSRRYWPRRASHLHAFAVLDGPRTVDRRGVRRPPSSVVTTEPSNLIGIRQ